MGLFLSWESVRIGLGLGQFTLLPLVAGLAAVLCTGTIGRGLLLGVALIKPQIGVAFVIWAILDGSIGAAVWAAAPAILGTLLFAARLGQSPLAVIDGFMTVVRQELRAPGFREGSLELRPLFHDLIPQATVADAVHLIVAVGSLAMIVVVSRLMTASNRARFLLPLTCLWTLMSMYHPTYDLVMLWPAFVALFAWYVDSGAKPLALGAIAAIQLALVVDVPGLWWKWNGRPFPVGDHGLLTTTILHFDRLLVSALFTMLVALSLRWQSSREPVTLANPVPVS
jgi:glycosyl transferase family 87